MEMSKYYVVLRSREKPREFQPALRWHVSFDSKTDFENWYTDEVKSRQEILWEAQLLKTNSK
ncbi:MAG: hypothetical protein ACD_15C00160G0002 [uncultured bacterium]|nr:MAG: hypothetical protein ACD_15C00160G0002 [uncultured bacterium]KKP68346.1 MAG: hypothetical protein UR66_C0006G0047 [Candidatus Moranbacteria bacterium GW2011_GWE1_35_17]KKP73167.1 MAG: hypothetical protein UR65_C0006G0011 [Candidatus Moranbacteria bacterium GW2011_GWE2_35_164]KKP84269.1 MAG: hypothetical protein UR82_C0009G0016 [Candidatus Moranbacteria bacterium GW2011_GWF1_35_5]KKP84918.1 MAG: hypothetical protein UR83_C0008G0032 [Candidatus Moranbacteria bacterium GW2011_GWF2_35_54]